MTHKKPNAKARDEFYCAHTQLCKTSAKDFKIKSI